MEIEIKQQALFRLHIDEFFGGVHIKQNVANSNRMDCIVIEKQSIPALIEALKKYVE